MPGDAETHRKYNSSSFVVAPGVHEDTIDTAAVDALVEKFRDANFFALKDEYSASMTDNATYVLEIDTGTALKRIVDYVGRDAGMPSSVTELENAVDRVAGTGRWVNGDDGLVGTLEKEGFDFRSENAGRMLLAATEDGGDRTLVALVHRGAPLDKVVGTATLGSLVLLAAVENGRVPLFRILVERGWLKRANQREINDAFASSAAGCGPTMADEAIAAGIYVDATTSPSHDERRGSDGAETALAALAKSYSCDSEPDRVATAKRLLANGADPNKRDREGETPIFEVESLELLNVLLAGGADAKAVDSQGNSAVFGTWTDDIVLRLLQAGASPKGRYYDGKTLLEQMRERPMPNVKAWLEAHPAALALAQSS